MSFLSFHSGVALFSLPWHGESVFGARFMHAELLIVCAPLFVDDAARASWSFAFFAALNCSREKHFDSSCGTVINKLLAGEIFSFIPCTWNASGLALSSQLLSIVKKGAQISLVRCKLIYH